MSDVIRISEQGKRQLIILKRTTKIDQWNILCRWALCSSIQDSAPLTRFELGPISNIEMSWDTFAGPFSPIFTALMKSKTQPTNQEPLFNSNEFFIYHIHRGITILVNKKPTIEKFILKSLLCN